MANATAPATFSVPDAASALLAAAVQHRLERDAAAHDERADALRRADLVAGERERVDAELVERERQPAGRLHGVGVDERARRVGDRGELGDRLHGADLVVGVLHRTSVVSGRMTRASAVGVHEAARVDRDLVDLEAVHAREVVGRLEHRLVLDRRRPRRGARADSRARCP